MQRIDKTNDGSSNKTLNNVHSMSKMAFAVKRLIKSSVLHDDKCRGVIIDHIEGSDDTLKVFIPSTEVDTELLKSKLALCRFKFPSRLLDLFHLPIVILFIFFT